MPPPFSSAPTGDTGVVKVIVFHSLLSTAHMDSMEEAEELLLSILPYQVKK